MNKPRDLANFFQGYAKRFSAGAFATPTAAELAVMPPSNIINIVNGDARTVITSKRLTRSSLRKDFTGRKFEIPEGAHIITHLARTLTSPPILPNLDPFDFIFTYIEDKPLSDLLKTRGWVVASVNVTAASEIVARWGRIGSEIRYPKYDETTFCRVPLDIPAHIRPKIIDEIQPLAGWGDDYPFYSDGSWSALNLRGFYHDDPTKGVKPSEMPKTWKAEHPDDLTLECGWTTLAERCPTIITFVENVGWWKKLERVRLLKMSGREGKGGALRRHTDITDRAAGTRDGQIVRFHIALQTNPKIKMTGWDLAGEPTSIHLAPFECWYLDQRKPHAVSNPTSTNRVHLVVDVASDSEIRDMIEATQP